MVEKKKKPEVRFKGFEDDWLECELANILTERKIYQKITNDAPILAFAAGQGVIDRSERKSNNRDHLTLDQENKIYKLTEYNDIVYNPSNLKYGAIDRNKHGRGVISPIYVTFTTKEEPSFVELIVKSEKFKLKALLYEEGTVVKRQSVKPENLLSLDVKVSKSLYEQSKIGNFFQNLDKLITLHQNKYDKLIILKKAMLEKMFPKNGSDVPEIRFKGFEGKWVKLTIADIGNFYYGKSAPKWSLKEDAPTYCVRYGELYTKYGATITKAYSRTNIDPNKLRFSKGGEILVPRVGEDPEDFGKHCCYLPLANIAIGEMISVFETTQNPLFYTYYFRTLYKEFAKVVEGKNVKNLYYKELEPIVIYRTSLPEQAKIGIYFQNLDNLISLHQKELEKLKNLKKACLEKMFV